MPARTGCCGCSYKYFESDFNDLSGAFADNSQGGTLVTSLTQITNDGSTLENRSYSSSTSVVTNVTSRQSPCVETKLDFSDSAALGCFVGQIFNDWVITPDGSDWYLHYRVDFAFVSYDWNGDRGGGTYWDDIWKAGVGVFAEQGGVYRAWTQTPAASIDGSTGLYYAIGGSTTSVNGDWMRQLTYCDRPKKIGDSDAWSKLQSPYVTNILMAGPLDLSAGAPDIHFGWGKYEQNGVTGGRIINIGRVDSLAIGLKKVT